MSADRENFISEFRAGGWRSVLCAAIGFGLGINVLPYYTLGTFVRPLQAEFDWSRAEIYGSIACIVVGTLLTASAWGWLTDRYGVRKVGIISQIGFAIALSLLAFTPGQLWYWYAIWFVMVIVGLGTSPITWTRSVAANFNKGRGLALAIALCGSGVSSIFLPPAAAFIIEHFGWRWAYFMHTLVVLFIALPVTIWILPADKPQRSSDSSKPEKEVSGLTAREAVRGRRFWLLILFVMLVGFAVSGLIPNLVPMMVDRGIEPVTAATLMGVLGMSIIVGRLATGIALDRIWGPFVALGLFPFAALACIVLGSGISDYFAASLCIILIGVATGAEFDLASYLVARYFGIRQYSQIYAIQWMAFTLAAGSAPILYSHFYDLWGNYALSLYISAGLIGVSPFMLLALGPYPNAFTARPIQPGETVNPA